MEFRSLPKVELHLHLDCSLSYKVVTRLAPKASRAEYLRDYVAPARCTNLADFLARAPMGFRLMQTEDALRAVTEDVFEQLVDDGVVYAELRFAPLLHVEKGLSAERVVEVVERATDELVRTTGVEAAFAGDAVKERVKRKVVEGYGEFDQRIGRERGRNDGSH